MDYYASSVASSSVRARIFGPEYLCTWFICGKLTVFCDECLDFGGYCEGCWTRGYLFEETGCLNFEDQEGKLEMKMRI